MFSNMIPAWRSSRRQGEDSGRSTASDGPPATSPTSNPLLQGSESENKRSPKDIDTPPPRPLSPTTNRVISNTLEMLDTETAGHREDRVMGEMNAYVFNKIDDGSILAQHRREYFDLLVDIRIRWRLDLSNPKGPGSFFFKGPDSVIALDTLRPLHKLIIKAERCWAGAIMTELWGVWFLKRAENTPEQSRRTCVLDSWDLWEWADEYGYDLYNPDEPIRRRAEDIGTMMWTVPRKRFVFVDGEEATKEFGASVSVDVLEGWDSDMESEVNGSIHWRGVGQTCACREEDSKEVTESKDGKVKNGRRSPETAEKERTDKLKRNSSAVTTVQRRELKKKQEQRQKRKKVRVRFSRHLRGRVVVFDGEEPPNAIKNTQHG